MRFNQPFSKYLSNKDSYKDHESSKKISQCVFSLLKSKNTQCFSQTWSFKSCRNKNLRVYLWAKSVNAFFLYNLTHLFNYLLPNLVPAKNFCCKRTKGTLIIKKVLARSIFQDIVETIRPVDVVFSVFIDETTDNTIKKVVAVVFRYFNKKLFKF